MKEEEILRLREVNSKLSESNTKYEEKISTLKSELEQMKQEKKAGSEGRKIGEKQNKTIQILGDSDMPEIEKVKKIGRGATSEVFEVNRRTQYALKVLDNEFLKRKKQEGGIESEEDSKSKDDDEEDQNEVELDIDSLKRFVKESEVLN